MSRFDDDKKQNNHLKLRWVISLTILALGMIWLFVLPHFYAPYIVSVENKKGFDYLFLELNNGVMIHTSCPVTTGNLQIEPDRFKCGTDDWITVEYMLEHQTTTTLIKK